MSLNEENDGEDPNKVAVTQAVQDELVHVINMSLSNIAMQVDNLNKHAERILWALSREVDKITYKYNTIYERAIQLNSDISKKTGKDIFWKATKEKSSQSASIQTDLYCPSNPLPAKTRKTHDVGVQTSPLYVSVPYCQDYPEVLVAPNCVEDTYRLITPYCQDYVDDIAIPSCQVNEELVIPYCVDSSQGLVVSPDISYYYKTCEEGYVTDVKEQTEARRRKKKQHVDHPTEQESVPQFTLMENDITEGHVPPTCIDLSHSHTYPSEERPSISSYPINEISKALTQAVGKVIARSPRPQRKEVRCPKNPESYVIYGVGKAEIKPQAQIQSCPKLEMFVNPTAAAASPTQLSSDLLPTLRPSRAECPTSKIHSQTQFPSPVLRTLNTIYLQDCLQTSPEVGIQTTESKQDFFPFPTSCPECYDIIGCDLLPQDNKQRRIPPMSTSPVLSQRIETKEKGSDTLGCASFVQSPPSLVYPPEASSFPQSPRHSASKSPRPSGTSTSRFSHQSPTRCIGSTCSKSSNAVLPRHSTPQNCQNPPIAESFSHSSRCLASTRGPPAYSSKCSVSPRCFDTQSQRFLMPTSGNFYMEEPTENLDPSSQQSTNLNSESFTLQSFLNFPQSTPSSIPSPQTLSMLQYAEDPMSPSTTLPAVFNKEKRTLLDSIRHGVLLQETEEHCILKAQIKISKK